MQKNIVWYYITLHRFWRKALCKIDCKAVETNPGNDLRNGSYDNNTITDGGVAPQCSFARPTRNTENTDSQRTLRNKKI